MFLRRAILVVRRGEEFRTAKILSVGPIRAAVEMLDFPRSFLNNPSDLRVQEIMRACPSLKEVTLDIRVDHLLRPKVDGEGNQVSWESMPVPNVEERYSFDVLSCLPGLRALKYRLVGDCYGWKRQFVQPVLKEIASRFMSTPGQISFISLGWVGWAEGGFGSRIPTVRGDGLVLAEGKPDVMDFSP